MRDIPVGRAMRAAVAGGRGGGERVVEAGGRGRGMRGVIKVLGTYDECPICLLPFGETTGMSQMEPNGHAQNVARA